jgi:hypothetical protein
MAQIALAALPPCSSGCGSFDWNSWWISSTRVSSRGNFWSYSASASSHETWGLSARSSRSRVLIHSLF